MDIAAETAAAYESLAKGDYAAAADRARRVLRHSPGDPSALTLFGRLALISQEPDIARTIFERLVQRPDARAATWLDLAQALLDLRRDHEAIDAVGHALSVEGDNLSALVKLGGIRMSLGEREKAGDAYQRALQLDAACTSAYRGLCQAVDMDPESPIVRRMEELATTPACSPREAMELHYSLAQVYHRSARDDQFIRHFFAANELQRAANPGDRAAYQESFDGLDAAFTEDAFRRAARAEPIEPCPIFILGMPRSGTTLVEQLICAEPGVAPGGELHYMRGPLRHALERETGRPFPAGFDELRAPALNALAAKFARRIGLISRGCTLVTDKTPGNYHLLGLLRILFPNGKIIHVARDPVDTCFSILQYQFEDRSPHTCDIDLLAYSYGRYVQQMRRWQELFGSEFITVQYERLVASPNEEARRIFEFCGLAWNDSYLEAARAGAAVRTFSATQVRRPIYKSSVGAWRRYATALQPLVRALERELGKNLDGSITPAQ
jgi:tetratricopeptide (TPR) repeat protein